MSSASVFSFAEKNQSYYEQFGFESENSHKIAKTMNILDKTIIHKKGQRFSLRNIIKKNKRNVLQCFTKATRKTGINWALLKFYNCFRPHLDEFGFELLSDINGGSMKRPFSGVFVKHFFIESTSILFHIKPKAIWKQIEKQMKSKEKQWKNTEHRSSVSSLTHSFWPLFVVYPYWKQFILFVVYPNLFVFLINCYFAEVKNVIIKKTPLYFLKVLL